MDYVFELGFEEIPARFLISYEDKMEDLFKSYLDKANIEYISVAYNATPRRMSFVIRGIVQNIPMKTENIYGPPRGIAYDHNGFPTKALSAFMEKNNIGNKTDMIKISNESPYKVYIQNTTPEVNISNILPGIIQDFISDIRFGKEMKWGEGDISFARPIRWLCSVLGDTHLPVSYSIYKSSNTSYGVRYKGNKVITINNASKYIKTLLDNDVIVSHKLRFNKIQSNITDICSDMFAICINDVSLIKENAYLTEQANVGYHSFNEKYLDLPDRILTTAVEKHQKYFNMKSIADDELLSTYIFVYDSEEKNIENVKSGTARVINARLADALFFYKNDCSVDFRKQTDFLTTLTYHNKLGTMKNKIDRIRSLSESIESDYFTTDEISNINTTIDLCKNDLLSQVIGEKEFSSLQGYIGKCYAKNNNINDVVCDAIEEHYYPRFSGDKLPSNTPGKLVSICNRIDNIVGMFSIGNTPKGNKDPYKLKRDVVGVIRIAMSWDIDININKLIMRAINIHGCHSKQTEIIDFFEQKALTYIKNSINISSQHEIYIINNILQTPYKCFEILSFIESNQGNKTYVELLNLKKRIHNITQGHVINDVIDCDLFKIDSEQNLFDRYLNDAASIDILLKAKKYTSACSYLLGFVDDVSNFLLHVIIMDNDLMVRNNRLRLSMIFNELYDSVFGLDIDM